MKKLLLIVFSVIPMMVTAQNVWERPDNGNEEKQSNVKQKKEKVEKPNPDAKYLQGAVSETTDGKVEWILDIDVPGKSATQIYDVVLKCFTDLTKTENQLEGSCVALVNKQEHIIVANVREWLIFKENFIALDRTKFMYNLVAYCSDNHLMVKMNRISYKYEEERRNYKDCNYTAEEWITDKYALNRKKTKLVQGSAKFRRKTVDRKDYLFSVIKQTVLK